MTRCERVLSLSPDMGFRPYEEDLYKTFVQILLGDSDLEDLISLLVWENCNDGFYVLSSTGVALDDLTPSCHMFLSLAAQQVVNHQKPFVLPGGCPTLRLTMSHAGFSSAALFPLTYRCHIAGCLVLARQHGPSPFQFTDLAQATLFGNILSDIFERLRLIEVVQSQYKAGRRAKRERERIQALPVPLLYADIESTQTR